MLASCSPNRLTTTTDTAANNTDLRPIHGILTTYGRKQAKTWACLVCGTSHSSIEHEECSSCKRKRVPSWLLDVHGHTVVPGSIVRCPRSVAQCVSPPPPVDLADDLTPPRNKARTPPRSSSPVRKSKVCSSTTSPVSPRQVAGAVRLFQSPPRRSGRSDQQRASASASPSRGDVVPRSPTSPQKRAPRLRVGDENNSGSVSVDLSKRQNTSTRVITPNARRTGKKVRGQAAFEAIAAAAKAKFEAQSGDCVVMVTAVTGIRPQPPRKARCLEGYSIMEGSDGAPVSRTLVRVVLDTAKGASLELVDPSQEGEEYDKFLDFGLCGRCDRTYRIVQGRKHVSPKSPKSRAAELETELARLLELVANTEQQKNAMRAAQDFSSTVKATNTIATLCARIATTRRALEPLVMSCPFCLWNCTTLFAIPGGKGSPEAAGNRMDGQRRNK